MPDERKISDKLNELSPTKFLTPDLKKDPTVWDGQVSGGHYKDFEIQPAEFNHKNKLDWCEGNIVKYTCRHN